MCKALNFTSEINDKIKEAKKYYNELCVKEKVLNDMQNDLLHKIEDEYKPDLYQGWQLTKSLHQIRVERRQIKNEKYNMELFLNQVPEEISPERIERAEQRQQMATFEKGYKKRVNELVEPLKDVQNALNVISQEHNSVSRTGLTKAIKGNKKINEKIFSLKEELPKEKGSSIKVRLTGKTKDLNNTYTKNLIKKYEFYELNGQVLSLNNRL